MTNKEVIKNMSQSQLAQFLCDVSNCATCQIREMCGTKYPCAFYDWLEDKCEGKDITKDFYTFKHSLDPTNHGVGNIDKISL